MSSKSKILCMLIAGVLLNVSLPAISCCSVQIAEFSNTYGWAGEAEKDGKLVHVMLYHNSANNLFSTSTSNDANLTEPSGNAMILPIPAVPGSMSSANMLAGSKYVPVGRMLSDVAPKFFEKVKDILGELLSLLSSLTYSMDNESKGAQQVSGGYEIFRSGSYTVVLAKSASVIPEALEKVPLKVRPKINKEIFDAYEKWYPGWTFALCCFEKEAGGEPIVWWYEPKDPSELFFPALDAHTGKPPVLHVPVKVDHHLTVSSNKMLTLLEGTPFSAVRKVLAAQPSDPEFVPKHIMGSQFSGRLPQGDFVFSTADLRMGIYRPYRKLPPGAPQDPLLSIATFLFDPTLLGKVICSYFLAAVLFLFQKRFKGSVALFVGAIVLSVVANIVTAPFAQAHYVATAFFQAAIATAALLIPIKQYAPKAHAQKYLIGSVFLVALLFLLPGYSSAWAPIAWSILLFMAALSRTQQVPAAAMETDEQT